MKKSHLLIALAALLAGGCSANLETPPPVPEPTPTVAPTNTKRPTVDPGAVPVRWPDAFAMNGRIGRGINFGNALEAPAEGEWGIVLREEYFQLVKDAGFTAVRLPVRWNTHALDTPPYTIHSSFFERVDWAVENALSRGLILILDFHHFTTYMDCAECEQERFLSIWAQIADHYRTFPPELLFELLNEPTNAVPADVWDADLASALEIVRATNPDRAVVVGPVGWNGLDALDWLKLPEEDRGLIVTFHYYEPFAFTHQGASWMEGSEAWLGTQWTGSAEEQRVIREDFSAAAEWGRVHNRPVLLGEFGAFGRADMASRSRYTAFIARQAEALSFSWAYWEFCSGFGVYDPAANGWREDLLRALIPEATLPDK
jgi:endoglucanase